jgi:hypothetical protein
LEYGAKNAGECFSQYNGRALKRGIPKGRGFGGVAPDRYSRAQIFLSFASFSFFLMRNKKKENEVPEGMEGVLANTIIEYFKYYSKIY